MTEDIGVRERQEETKLEKSTNAKLYVPHGELRLYPTSNG